LTRKKVHPIADFCRVCRGLALVTAEPLGAQLRQWLQIVREIAAQLLYADNVRENYLQVPLARDRKFAAVRCRGFGSPTTGRKHDREPSVGGPLKKKGKVVALNSLCRPNG
jgi:hypothetical protein